VVVTSDALHTRRVSDRPGRTLHRDREGQPEEAVHAAQGAAVG
jgi:hypothetical protein